MGFFENRRIKKEIAELEAERARIEPRFKKLQEKWIEEKSTAINWIRNVDTTSELTMARSLASMPDTPSESEYLAIGSRIVEIDGRISKLKSQLQ